MKYKDFTNWVDLLRMRAALQPDMTAFTYLADEGKEGATITSLTFAELDAKARAIAARLRQSAEPGETAILLYLPGLGYITAFFGCLYAGLIAVPLYPPQGDRKKATVKTIAKDCGATLALTTAAVLERMGSRSASASELDGLRWTATDRIADAEGAAWRPTPIDDDAVAYLQYTSGSTSEPKGVIIGHKTAAYQCAELVVGWGMSPESVVVSWLPHFHDLGQVFAILQPVYLGSPCVFMSPASFIVKPYRWLKAISDYKGTHAATPSFGFDHCVDNISPEQRSSLNLSSWVTAVIGAEPVREATIERFYDAFAAQGLRRTTVCPSYGLAEATLRVTSRRWGETPSSKRFSADELGRGRAVVVGRDEPDARALVSCGTPVLATRIAIVDPETHELCVPGQVGEIWVSGPNVAGGYYRRPSETRRDFHAYVVPTREGPFLRTGDLGFIHDGELYVTGRAKDVIIIRGANHYPQDLELTVETSHPCLRSGYSAVFAVEEGGEERIVILVEKKRDYPHDVDLDQVIHTIRRQISREHGVEPSAVVVLRAGSIPKTSSGKIQRRACHASYLKGEPGSLAHWRDNATPSRAPSDKAPAENLAELVHRNLRAWLIGWIARQTRVSEVEVDLSLSLSSQGLDSVGVFTLHTQLEKWLGMTIAPERMLRDDASIDGLIVELLSQMRVS